MKDDLEGYQQLAGETTVMLAAGEREFEIQPFRRLAQTRAVSILQPDIIRVGGVTGWRRVAALAEAHFLRVAPHFYKEFDVHLAASTPNLVAIEWFDWIDPLLENPLEIRDGLAVVPSTPGFGLDLKPEAVAEYEVTSE